jgi:hypothetical protein
MELPTLVVVVVVESATQVETAVAALSSSPTRAHIQK